MTAETEVATKLAVECCEEDGFCNSCYLRSALMVRAIGIANAEKLLHCREATCAERTQS